MGSSARGLCSIPRGCEPSKGVPFDVIDFKAIGQIAPLLRGGYVFFFLIKHRKEHRARVARSASDLGPPGLPQGAMGVGLGGRPMGVGLRGTPRVGLG